VTRLDEIERSLRVLRPGGKMVCFGEPHSRGELLRILGKALACRLRPGGKKLALYGTSTYFLGDRKPYIEDWAALFKLLEQGKIQPVIERTFPLAEAAQAHALLESGQVTGNVVLTV
jgi:NADPH:quinone reductase-like Zn-dependent oxidoreductase